MREGKKKKVEREKEREERYAGKKGQRNKEGKLEKKNGKGRHRKNWIKLQTTEVKRRKFIILTGINSVQKVHIVLYIVAWGTSVKHMGYILKHE